MKITGPGNVVLPHMVPARNTASSGYVRALDPIAAIPRGEREQWAAAQHPYGQEREALRIAALRRNAALTAAARSERAASTADDAPIAGEQTAAVTRAASRG